MTKKRLFRRETLVKNLRKLVNRIKKEELPATVRAVYVYGGFLRGKEKAKDIDVAVEYELTPEQEYRWKAFTEIVCGSQMRELFRIADALGYTLEEFASLPRIEKVFSDAKMPWLKYLSWSDVLYGVECQPQITKVISKQLRGRSRGLHIWMGPPPSENYIKVWSPDAPNIEENLAEAEKLRTSILKKELIKFIEQEKDRRKEFERVAKRVKTLAEELQLKLSIKVDRININPSEEKNIKQLEKDCEALREKLNEYDDVTYVLELVTQAIEHIKTNRMFQAHDDPHNYTPEEYIVKHVLSERRWRDLTENRARDILRKLGLPEDRIITIKYYNARDYRAFSSPEEKERLIKYKSRVENIAKYQRAANRPLKNRNYRAHVVFNEHDNPEEVRIECGIWVTHEIAELINGTLGRAGFKTEHRYGAIKAEITIPLSGQETPKEVEEKVKEVFKKVKSLNL